MTDQELVGYTILHSRTERALFAKEHIAQLLRMAGAEGEAARVENECPAFMALRPAEADRILAMIDKAQANT